MEYINLLYDANILEMRRQMYIRKAKTALTSNQQLML